MTTKEVLISLGVKETDFTTSTKKGFFTPSVPLAHPVYHVDSKERFIELLGGLLKSSWKTAKMCYALYNGNLTQVFPITNAIVEGSTFYLNDRTLVVQPSPTREYDDNSGVSYGTIVCEGNEITVRFLNYLIEGNQEQFKFIFRFEDTLNAD